MGKTEFLTRLAAAFILGGLIGFERQYRHHMAGIKTNVLVSLGACLYIMFSNIGGGYDNARLAAQVISGIGFLGGGVIIREGFNIRGLSTAATLWCTAAVGVLASQGYIFEAFVGTAMILITNIVLRPLSLRMYHNPNPSPEADVLYMLNVKCAQNDEFHIRSLLINIIKEERVVIKNLSSAMLENSDTVKITAIITCIGNSDNCVETIAWKIGSEKEVQSVGWEMTDIIEH